MHSIASGQTQGARQMNALKQMSERAKTLGCIKGESATEWRKRDPKAAEAFAAFIVANKKQIVGAISGVLQK